MISEEEVNKARMDLVRYGNEWKKRKRGCMDIVDMICESADLNRKEFIVSLIQADLMQKKVSIETDEEFKANVNDFLA